MSDCILKDNKVPANIPIKLINVNKHAVNIEKFKLSMSKVQYTQ